ncbi:MAG: hypothetical protein HPY69_18335 [Armatimonadetes bacterium]|nr:hypothetical protein [Armatimonadota bacterium]
MFIRHSALAGIIVAALACAPVVVHADQQLRVIAYINVTSGCQQPTVNLLEQFARTHGDRVHLEVVDFGDGGAGQRRWRESGHTCLTIALNGSPRVQFPVGGEMREVTFQMPAGFQWTHDDLEAALQAGLNGTLRPLPLQPKQPASAAVTVKKILRANRVFYQVVVGSKPVLSLGAAHGSQSAIERARVASEVIKAWLARRGKASEVGTRQLSSGWGVTAGGRLVVTVTATDANLQNSTPKSLAGVWAANIKQVAPAR